MNRQDDFDDGWVGIFKNFEKLENSLYKSLGTLHECGGKPERRVRRTKTRDQRGFAFERGTKPAHFFGEKGTWTRNL